MQRFALLVEYDGTDFVGLQRQSDGPSIQSAFEDACAKFGVTDPVFRAAGRTDSGVHARGQVICLTLPEKYRDKNLQLALNWHLPESIRVRAAVPCSEDFDPRRDARRRTYRYLLAGAQPLPPLMRGRMGQVKARLDLEKLRAVAREFVGDHDFRAWRSTQCQAPRTQLTLERLDVEPWPDAGPHGLDWQTFQITVSCRSFLHRMVRFLVGGVARGGAGALSPQELRQHLRDGTLPPLVQPADARGLSLERVEYLEGTDPFAAALKGGTGVPPVIAEGE